MMRGRGGTADALASGASGGNPVEVQILSTAPFLSITVIFNHNAVVAERQTHHLEGVAGRPVWVQIPPTAPKISSLQVLLQAFYFSYIWGVLMKF